MNKIIAQTLVNQLTVRESDYSFSFEQVSILSDGSKYNTGRMSLSKTELVELRDYLNSIELEGK